MPKFLSRICPHWYSTGFLCKTSVGRGRQRATLPQLIMLTKGSETKTSIIMRDKSVFNATFKAFRLDSHVGRDFSWHILEPNKIVVFRVRLILFLVRKKRYVVFEFRVLNILY